MTSTTSNRYGWIGLGNMGVAMATNLQRHLSGLPDNSPLAYTNRTLSRGEPLAALGARGYATPAEVVESSDVIFISLSDDTALLDLLTTLTTVTSNLSNKLLVDTTTISPSTSSGASILVSSHPSGTWTYLAAPVFGATPVAAAGRLLFALGGPSDAIARIQPLILACLGRSPVLIAGPHPQDATLVKALGNFVTASMAQTLSEAHVLAEKAGMDDKVLGELVQENYGDYAASISAKLMTGVHAPERGEKPRSDVKLAVKDVGIGIEVAREKGVQLEVGELCLRRLKEARDWGEREGRELDSSSVYGIVRERAGLGFEREDVLEERKRRKAQEESLP